MSPLFGITLFLSAALLFLVQPMVAKMLLPSLGGTPNVWITCMLFFQAGLLAGYAYAHAGCRWLGVRGHAVLHLLLLILAFVFLPIELTDSPAEGDPTWWLLLRLLVGVGLPYMMVSSSGPLLQKWFANVRSPEARDPYFLYAASNLGSFIGLLSYLLVIEPNTRLSEQSIWWMWGYLVFALLVFVCSEWSRAAGAKRQADLSSRPGALIRLRWVFLALVPSSLMLSVTTYLTTDIASVPFLWVLPVAIYLLSFVVVFARWRIIPHWLMLRTMPAAVIVVVLVLLSEATEPPELLIALHLLGLFWLCMVCHGELARTRPAAEHLTEFYLWLAFGGALGGLFNAVISPLVFNTVAEYPIMLADSRGDIDIIIGDARLKLQKQPDHSFGLIVIDAFSSDSIPVHLLTREALALYRKKLRPDGLIAFHISNRYLDLQPVLAALANDAEPRMIATYQEGYVASDDKARGRLASE